MAGLLLVTLAGATYGRHILHGGLYSDDWSLGAMYRFPSPSGRLHDFLTVAAGRPVQAVYLLLTFAVFGMSAPAQLACAVVLAVLASLLFYLLLRAIGVRPAFAWAMAALALLFPESDATRLWADADPQALAMCLYFAGALLMLRALRSGGRGSAPSHLISAALYAASIMTYEITAPLVAVSALGCFRFARRRVIATRAAADAVLTVLVLALVTAQTHKQSYTAFGQMITHTRAIITQSVIVLSESLFPFYSVPEKRLPLALFVIILGSGVFLLRQLPADARELPLLRQGLAMTVGGTVAAFAGWAMLIPSNIVYSPAQSGDGTRINIAAGFGVVVGVFGLLLMCVVLVVRGLPRSIVRAHVAALVLATIVGIGYLHRTELDIGDWDSAAATRAQVMQSVRATVHDPPSGSDVYVTGFDLEPYSNIGTFDVSWDFNGALQLAYNDPSLVGLELVSPGLVKCTPHGFVPAVQVTQSVAPLSAYSRTDYLVEVGTRSAARLSSRTACLAAGGTAG